MKRPLKKGANGNGETRKVQTFLKALGHYHGALDDDFGPKTETAVKEFQQKRFVTGIVNEYTYEALEDAFAEKNPPPVPLPIKEKQTFLKAKGYYLGAIDGMYGPASRKAEKDFKLAERVDARTNLRAAMVKPDYDGVTNNFLRLGQYYDSVYPKKQIVIHHTAGGPSATATKNWWDSNPQRLATDFIIDQHGSVIRTFPKGYWAWHIGLGRPDLDSQAIGIEVCNYGYLTKQGTVFRNAYGGIVNNVYTLAQPYRGHTYYENYTDAQFASLDKLLRALVEEYDIPLNKETFRTGQGGIFELMPEATSGKKGIYAHGAYLAGKTDMYPHPKLLSLLKSL
jgi:N-acetyl-anhydromuramyl-L-alanine amidase AmpD